MATFISLSIPPGTGSAIYGGQLPSSNLFTRHESKFLVRVPEKGGSVKFMEV